MGLKANFTADAVEKRLKSRGRRSTLKLENRLKSAALEIHEIARMIAPVKRGTLTRAIRIKRISRREWTVYVREEEKVRNKNLTVGVYLKKIEGGDFKRIGKKSRARESSVNKRRLAGLRVKRSPQGSYVGGVFFGRTIDAVEEKWHRRFDKIFKEAMERGQI